MQGDGRGESSCTFVPARAAAKDKVGVVTSGTVDVIKGVELDCTNVVVGSAMPEECVTSDTHGHWHS